MNETELTIALRDGHGLEEPSCLSIIGSFKSFLAMAGEWKDKALAIVINDEGDRQGMTYARESRLALRSVRIEVEKTRVSLKEHSLRRGKAIDYVANVLKTHIEPLEAHLLEQEQFAERAEQERASMRFLERVKACREAGIDSAGIDLRAMEPDVFTRWLDDSKTLLAFRRQREEREAEEKRLADEKAEQERRDKEAADAAERVRVNAENAKLKSEAVEKDRLAKIERDKLEAAAAKEREARQLLQAKIDADAKAAADKAKADKEAARLAAIAPEREKLRAFLSALSFLEVPECEIRPLLTAKLDELMGMVMERIGYGKGAA